MKWLEGPNVYFDPREFDCAGLPGTGLVHMDLSFVEKLNNTRKLYGKPMRVTSGYRTVEHERKILAGKPGLVVASMQGPNPFSAHTGGHGADIACSGSRERYELIRAAIAAGINRIGFDVAHVHLDDDPRLPPNVIWLE